jgi:hypothetical protein
MEADDLRAEIARLSAENAVLRGVAADLLHWHAEAVAQFSTTAADCPCRACKGARKVMTAEEAKQLSERRGLEAEP